ncbi:unnamed protein product [Urochloa humidicola]
MKRISDSSVKKHSNSKGRCSKAPKLEKKIMSIQEYLNESSNEDHCVFTILQFLFSMRTSRDELLRGSPDSEQECFLRETIYEIFTEWKKQEFERTSEIVSSFKEALFQACNDRGTFPQVRNTYASEAVAHVLKKLHVSFSSTLGIKMLFKARCCCGSSDTESVTLLLKFDTEQTDHLF